jgi:hypothetical protein
VAASGCDPAVGRRAATAWRLVGLAVVGLVVGCGGGDSVDGDRHWIGFYPPLRQLHVGQSRSDVQRILGAPGAKRVKKRLSENGFGQGEREAHIKEGWIYSPAGWHGNIEVYFGPGGTVVGVNHGNG